MSVSVKNKCDKIIVCVDGYRLNGASEHITLAEAKKLAVELDRVIKQHICKQKSE